MYILRVFPPPVSGEGFQVITYALQVKEGEGKKEWGKGKKKRER